MSQSQELSELRAHRLDAILVSEPYVYKAESTLSAVEVLPGVSVIRTGGHSKGHQAIVVRGTGPGAKTLAFARAAKRG